MKDFLKYNWPSILWAAFILYLSLISGNSLPKIKIPNIDKVVHFTFYFVLVAFMFYGWRKQNSFLFLHKNPLVKIVCIAITYGFCIEIMQHEFTTTRHFDLLDVFANSTGAIAGSLISVKLFK